MRDGKRELVCKFKWGRVCKSRAEQLGECVRVHDGLDVDDCVDDADTDFDFNTDALSNAVTDDDNDPLVFKHTVTDSERFFGCFALSVTVANGFSHADDNSVAFDVTISYSVNVAYWYYDGLGDCITHVVSLS